MPARTSAREAQIEVRRLDYSSFELFADAIGRSDGGWRQLDQGPFEASLFQVASAEVMIERLAFNRRFAHKGRSTPGRIELGLIGRDVGDIRWCRQEVSADDVIVLGPGQEYEALSRPGFRCRKISYSWEHLERTAADLGIRLNLNRYREGGIALKIDPALAEDLRIRLRQLERALMNCPDDAGKGRIHREIETEITIRLLQLLAADPPTAPSLNNEIKARVARSARDFIVAHAAESPPIQEVSRAVGISWRSLNYAFREVFDVTPKQYLQATRLEGARKDLHRRGPGVTIADIANAWGFWHMGQFAADYRRHYGELPSETLR